jgi:hypothetical protein
MNKNKSYFKIMFMKKILSLSNSERRAHTNCSMGAMAPAGTELGTSSLEGGVEVGTSKYLPGAYFKFFVIHVMDLQIK